MIDYIPGILCKQVAGDACGPRFGHIADGDLLNREIDAPYRFELIPAVVQNIDDPTAHNTQSYYPDAQ